MRKQKRKGERRRQVGGAGWLEWEESADPQQLVDPTEAAERGSGGRRSLFLPPSLLQRTTIKEQTSKC